jgi:alginate O-acetyltransferase complex protein AlgJ
LQSEQEMALRLPSGLSVSQNPPASEPDKFDAPKRQIENFVTAIFFLTPLVVLSVLTAINCRFSDATYSADEKRALAPAPKFHDLKDLKAFPSSFDHYWNDKFAFRAQLMKWDSITKWSLFQTSTHPWVLVGTDGWLYLTDESDKATLRHDPLFSANELSEWTRVLEARRRWLAKRNIKYIVVVAPSKCTIYPEHIPDNFKPLRAESRLDQFVEAMRTRTSVRVLDLRPAMLKAKGTEKYQPIYFKNDSHWNFVGGRRATSVIVNAIADWFPSLSSVSDKDTQVVRSELENGDLAGMLGLKGYLKEEQVLLVPNGNFSWHDSKDMPRPPIDVPHRSREPFATEVDNPHLPKAVALRDSFFQTVKFYLSNYFRRISYYWQLQEFPAEAIEKEHPDIVIQEIVERFLASEVPHNPPAVDANH